MLGSNSTGITLIYNNSFTVSVIMSYSASPPDFTISDNKPDDPATIPFILLIYCLTRYLKQGISHCLFLRKNIPISCKRSKLIMLTFSSYLLMFVTICQRTIIIPYALPTNDLLISFDHPLYSLKHITFLIIPQHIVSKAIPFWFTFDLVNSPLSSLFCF